MSEQDSISSTLDVISSGTYMVTVTDNNNNVSTCISTVTVQDNVAPVAICQDITIQFDANGDATITAGGAVVIDAGADGDILLTPATNTVAGLTLVLNAKVGIAEYTGQTTGSTAQVTFVLTNNEISATSGIIATVNNIGANDARMTLERVEPGAGTCNFMCQNNGAAALNGDVYISFMVLS